ncbi:radical SAM protein [Parabacteroides sp. PF5-6]|uniref:radical SAM protein n=1 Tax=Parabacteroides sp. PF5-6 TaxID=1742403 RepID=UPI0024072778|nr:radical SAM protein [Parabacteroides sp. PF5-6]MDF9829146.1 biotin synthase [Parabacteroides sp. PF5-6]
MKADKNFLDLIEKIQSGYQITQQECAFLLQFPETSLESAITRGVADVMSREKFDNTGLVFGQIGFEVSPCPGKCKFCSISEEHTQFEKASMSDENILASADNFTASGDLFALALMAMHNYDFERVLHVVAMVRSKIPAQTQIVINIGDFDLTQAKELKAAGANGAYHLTRLREGIDTTLDPEIRKQTMGHIKQARLDLYYCCEPIGPEHTPEEMAEQIFRGIDYGCFQHGAMRRVLIPTSPLAKYGQISELRLAQVTAVVTLSALSCTELKSIGVHEPNLLGITAGANAIYAETGINPRDTEKETSGHRGLDISDCKQMLTEAGFSKLFHI